MSRVRQLPRVMPLADAARDVLQLDPHEAYRLARAGGLAGAFKIGKRWYVSLTLMIAGMQSPAGAEDDDPFDGAPGRPRR